MVVPPQEPDRAPSNITTPSPISSKGKRCYMSPCKRIKKYALSVSKYPFNLIALFDPGMSKQRQASLQPGSPASVSRGPEAEPLPPFHLCQPLECIVEETEGKLNELGQRISAIEKAQLQSLELIQGEPLTKDKIEELKKSREEQVWSSSWLWM